MRSWGNGSVSYSMPGLCRSHRYLACAHREAQGHRWCTTRECCGLYLGKGWKILDKFSGGTFVGTGFSKIFDNKSPFVPPLARFLLGFFFWKNPRGVEGAVAWLLPFFGDGKWEGMSFFVCHCFFTSIVRWTSEKRLVFGGKELPKMMQNRMKFIANDRFTSISSLKLTVRPWKVTFPIGKTPSNHHFSGAMLNFGGVNNKFKSIVLQSLTFFLFTLIQGCWEAKTQRLQWFTLGIGSVK